MKSVAIRLIHVVKYSILNSKTISKQYFESANFEVATSMHVVIATHTRKYNVYKYLNIYKKGFK